VVNQERLAAHLQVERYGAFWLTNAVRPSLDLQVVPNEGYRVDTYRDPRNRLQVPVLAAAVSRERLFETFQALLEPFSEVVDVVLETSHQRGDGRHQDLCREAIDLPVLTSHFYDFEDLLLHDGCTGVAIISTTEPMELQFDEHKLLILYARQLQPFQRILGEAGVPRNDALKLITEGEHLHNSDAHHEEEFQQLCYRLGVGEAVERVSW
jgi:hypothetical protein